MHTSTPFKWRHFQADIILLCIRWYLRYPLSYRDLEEMMLERGLHIDHTTIYRWVLCYAPELEKRCRCSSRIKLRTQHHHFTCMREYFGRNKVADWKTSHFCRNFGLKNKVADSDPVLQEKRTE